MEMALSTLVAQIHSLLSEDPKVARLPTKATLAHNAPDLSLAASHNCFQYLLQRLKRIKRLSDAQRNGLVEAMIRAGISSKRSCNLCASFTERADWTDLRSCVDTILTLNRHVNSFHLSIYVRLGYREMPRFLLVQLSKGIQRMFRMLHDTSRQAEPALLVWACNYDETGEGEEDATPESQLQVLLTLGVDINDRSLEGYNIVHYLISKHIVGHTYLEENDLCCLPHDDFVEALEKLYLVHKAGADFKLQFEHRTPLQALRHGLDRIRETPANQRFYEDIQEGRFAHLEYVLEHEERTGHLPTPMLGRELRAKPKDALQHRCDRCEGADNIDLSTIHQPGTLIPTRKAPKPPIPPVGPNPTTRHSPRSNDTNSPRGRHISRSPISRSSRSSNTWNPGGSNTASSDTSRPSRNLRPSRSPQPSRSPRYLEPTASSRQRELTTHREAQSRKEHKPAKS